MKSKKEPRVKGVAAWAAALELNGFPPEKAKDWAAKMLRDGYEQGVQHVA